ncbi:MAG TPA: isoprenylcysteine carboxyl methyltransferase [Ruminococcus sp.]|nr:isoprenylcysteine carboxyl methyltransferase [Ruminococcus sp.]
MKNLAASAAAKYFAGLLLCMLLVFLPAGTLHFAGGWLFLGVLFLPMLVMGLVLLTKNPELLEKRIGVKEEQSAQKMVVKLSGLMFLGGFVLSGLDYRFQWMQLPLWCKIAAAVIFLLGYGMYAEVLRENTYLSRTVEVQENQQVIDTGLYGIVRHPMYTATILMFVMIPLMLGSLAALPVFLLYPVIILLRIGNEEKVLEQGLQGYAEYRKKVKYRLFPFIW